MKKEKILSKFKNLIPDGKKGYFLIYTLLFVVVASLIYIPFLINDKGFLWIDGAQDGYCQHYTAFRYLGVWGREIIRNIFNGVWEIPMWDFSIGYGGDIISAMHYYAIGDLLDLVSIVVPQNFSEIAFDILVFVRLYLSGLAFSALAFKFKSNRSAILAGTIAYVFCGYAVYAGVKHPFFLNPMIYLPLVILGAEKILRKEKPLLFVFMIFITTLSNFYFLYMIAVAVVLFVIIRYFTMERSKSFKDFMVVLAKFASTALLGIGMGCIIFLPVVNVFLTSSRLVQVGVFPDLLYEEFYYQKLFTSMFSTSSPDEWACFGFAPLIFVALVLMFMNKKKYKGLKIGFVVLVLMLCFPIVGKVMNGFSYVNNRWSFIFSALMAFVLVAVWEDFFALSKKKIAGLFISGAVYFGILMYCRETINYFTFIALSFIFASMLLLVFNYTKMFKGLTTKAVSILLVISVALSCGLMGYEKNSAEGGNYTKEFMPYDESKINVKNSSDAVLAKISKDETTFVRTDQDYVTDINSAVLNGNYGTHFYWSLDSGFASTFLTENCLRDFIPQKYHGLDNRAYLMSLASIKYFSKATKAKEPYGYEKIKKVRKDDRVFTLYENTNPLPLGYTYSGYIERQDYENMSAEEKQQAMLQGLVLDTQKADLSAYEKVTPQFNHKYIDSEITLGKSIALQADGSYIVHEDKDKITISFDGMENCETYLLISGIKAETKTKYQLYMDDCEGFYSKEEFEEKTKAEKNALKRQNDNHREGTDDLNFKFKVCRKEASRVVNYSLPEYSFYSGQNEFLVNLGYSEEKKTECSFQFPSRGVYSFDKIQVICQPMENFDEQVNALKEDIMVNEEIGTNSVSGEISLQQDKILCLSIPYSQGWSATVDGEEVELLQANTMYMAIPLKAGNHKIQLNYTTPMLIAGGIISLVSFGAFIGIAVAYFIIGRKKKKFKN